MNSKETFEKIVKRSKSVIECGNTRNTSYSEYLSASLSYDNLKQGFYIAVKLSRHDEKVPEEQIQRYEHLVRHFDQQLLKQFKERNYEMKKILNEDDTATDIFHDRVAKLEKQGLLRNRMYFEFIDCKEEFEGAKKLFYDENSLAVNDGLMTNIDLKIHMDSMKMTEKSLDIEMMQIRQDYTRNRAQNNCTRGSHGNGQGGQGRHIRGQGRNIRGRGHNIRGRAHNIRGRGHNIRGRGHNIRGRGGNIRGQ